MVKAKVFKLVKHFDGLPKDSDFKLVTEDLPPIKDGEYLCEAVYLSVDPYMRVYTATQELGTTMMGGQVAKVLESKNKKYPVGKHIFGPFGWRSHTINCGKEMTAGVTMAPYVVPELKGHPMSLYLGMLGMPGNTAYFGFTDKCQPKRGETAVISGAAGAVGSHVGQIAKILGLKVIGIVGDNEKGEWLKTLGFDAYINYKTEEIQPALDKVAPKGVDCYFDNVGGEMSSDVIQKMSHNGRVAVCGAISAYNDGVMPKATMLQLFIVGKELVIKGLHAQSYSNRWMEGINQNKEWIESGKLKHKEHIIQGFDNMPRAFASLFTGESTGKVVVHA